MLEIRVKDVDIENHTATFYCCNLDAYIENLNVNTECSYYNDNQVILLSGAKLTSGADSSNPALQNTIISFPNENDHIDQNIAALAQAKTE